MKTLFTVILIFISTVCWGYDNKPPYTTEILKVYTVSVGSGYVLCVWTGQWRSGVSCNWEAYNKRQEKKVTK